MKTAVRLTLLAALCVGCATAISKGGSQVKVFGLDEAAKNASGAMPAACRLLESTPPFDQQENERLVEDPYARQRNEVAAKGGDVLLVRSRTLLRQPSQDCSPRAQSYDCQQASQTWYRVSLDYYACGPEALRQLEAQAAAAPPPAGALFTWKFAAASPSGTPPAPTPQAATSQAAVSQAATPQAPTSQAATPQAGAARTGVTQLKSKILAMMHESVGTDVIVAYVKAEHLPERLTADDIIDWKKAGIDEKVIEAALTN